MGSFFIDVQRGRVATRRQLEDAGIVRGDDTPPRPWHPIQGPSDASTMWYVVLRKRRNGVFIGTLCIRHTGRQASLEEQGWEEVPVAEIGFGAGCAAPSASTAAGRVSLPPSEPGGGGRASAGGGA